jgi:hypothetical protein
MPNLRVLALSLLTFLLLSQQTMADALTSAQLAAALKGSSWTGTFGTSVAGLGLNGNIFIQFSPKLATNGAVQYMHKVDGGGVLGTVVGPFDKACPSTPRDLQITGTVPPDGFSGQIQVYKCSEDGTRKKKGAPIPVKKISLADGGRSLEIDAEIAKHTVAYKLQKIDPATGHTEQSAGEKALVREAGHAKAAR